MSQLEIAIEALQVINGLFDKQLSSAELTALAAEVTSKALADIESAEPPPEVTYRLVSMLAEDKTELLQQNMEAADPGISVQKFDKLIVLVTGGGLLPAAYPGLRKALQASFGTGGVAIIAPQPVSLLRVERVKP